MSSESKPRVLYENLDTSFVNLWALLRHLSQRAFVGRVHVEMDDYSADVFLTGSNTPLVREVDRAAGTEVLEEAAMHRLVLRARETPGTISVFEGADEAVAVRDDSAPAKTEDLGSTTGAGESSIRGAALGGVTDDSPAPVVDPRSSVFTGAESSRTATASSAPSKTLIVPGVSRARRTSRCIAASSSTSVPAARSTSRTSGVFDPVRKTSAL